MKDLEKKGMKTRILLALLVISIDNCGLFPPNTSNGSTAELILLAQVGANIGNAQGSNATSVSTPVFSPTPGHVTTAQSNITITTSTPGASIYYSTDGTTPTTASTVYTSGLGHIWSIAGKTIKAIAVKSGSTDSAISTAEYSYSPLKSGQTTSFVAGDDGSSQLGVARSYTNNGDGTVTDNATGLLWHKCALGRSGESCTGSHSGLNYAAAQSACQGLTTAGKTWRLPTRYELETLLDFGTSGPAINVAALPDSAGSTGDEYWTTTTYTRNSNTVWGVWIRSSGTSSGQNTGVTRTARCIAGSAQNPLIQFVDNGDGTVKEKHSGLVWQKCSVGQTNNASCSGVASTVQWTTALTTCSSLSLAGKTWRLPSIKELTTIVNSTVASGAAIDTTVFPSTVANGYWSSTTRAADSVAGWIANFTDGSVLFETKTNTGLVRCVSGP